MRLCNVRSIRLYKNEPYILALRELSAQTFSTYGMPADNSSLVAPLRPVPKPRYPDIMPAFPHISIAETHLARTPLPPHVTPVTSSRTFSPSKCQV
ncbi:hypothetical protein U1Q18_017330 [Sarracenia purpurea var. burkii]